MKYRDVREQVENGKVKLEYCPTEEMVADIFKKGLSQMCHVKLRLKLNVSCEAEAEVKCEEQWLICVIRDWCAEDIYDRKVKH